MCIRDSASITVAGLACHPAANGRYNLEPVPLNGRSHYTTAGGAMHLYWTPSGGITGGAEWLLDRDTDDASDAEAYLISPSEAPPTGSAVWQEWCDGWTDARLELTPAFSSKRGAWCEAALAALAPTLTATCCADDDGPGLSLIHI